MDNVFNEKAYWEKLSRFALKAGREVVERSLYLYYAAQRPETPVWAKTAMYGALVYFISPIDAIPDIMPFFGFTDDVAVMAAAVGMVSMYINDDVRSKAKNRLSQWFGSARGETIDGVWERKDSKTSR